MTPCRPISIMKKFAAVLVLLILAIIPGASTFSLRVPTHHHHTGNIVIPIRLQYTAALSRFSLGNPKDGRVDSRFLASESTTTDGDTTTSKDDPPRSLFFLMDINTKGGVLFWGLVLFVTPLVGYELATRYWVEDGMSMDDQLQLGTWIGGGVAGVLLVGWVSSLLVRIVNKDMTYAKQLKDYETAVLEKRLEELDDDERQALLETVQEEDRESF